MKKITYMLHLETPHYSFKINGIDRVNVKKILTRNLFYRINQATV